jgi:DNA-binding transcriptional LysR family regulator
MEATMDLNLVSTFVKVGEAASFTAAARALGLPTSSVSRKVSALEAALDVRLIQRSTRKLVLTEAGRAYFERARASLGGLAEATAAVADRGHEIAGPIRFTAASDGSGVLASLLSEFLEKYPKVSLEVIMTPRRVDLVAEGVDLALRAGRLGDSSLIVRRISTTDLGLYASAAYLRRAGTPRALAELARHRFVMFGPPDVRHTLRLTGPAGEESVAIDGPLVADEMPFAASMVSAGVGIGLLPTMFADHAAGRRLTWLRAPLVRVLPEHRAVGGDLQLVSPPTAYEPARVSLLRDFLAERYATLLRRCSGAGADAGVKAKPSRSRPARRR